MTRLSLRLVLPLVIAAFSLLATGFGYVSSRHSVLLEVQDHLIHEVGDHVTLLQRNALQNSSLGQLEQIHQAIMWLATDPAATAILVADSQGLIIAANNDQDHARPWRDLPYKIDPKLSSRSNDSEASKSPPGKVHG